MADDLTSEADHADWTDPAQLLRDAAAGRALMLPPTVVCVEEVARAGSAAGFVAERVPVRPVEPVPARVGQDVVIRCELPR